MLWTAGVGVDCSGGQTDERTPRKRLARIVGRVLLDPLEDEPESESEMTGGCALSRGGVDCCTITLIGPETTGLLLGGEEGVLCDREPDDTLRGIRGSGAPAVFMFREKRFSLGGGILREVSVAIIES